MSEHEVVVHEDMTVATVLAPHQIMEKAREMSVVLKDAVKRAGLARKIGNKEYLEYEAWQTIGRFHNCTPVTEWMRPIEREGYRMEENGKVWGWEARVVVQNEAGQIIGSSEGMCTRAEKRWSTAEDYAIRSMAQTRTAGKALRMTFSWVATLAGYAPTPAEEMDGVEVREPSHEVATPGAPVTTFQKKKILALCTEKGMDREDAKRFYEHAMEEQTIECANDVINNFESYYNQFTKEQV